MKNLNNYITEKLKLDKDIKVIKKIPTEDEFIKALDYTGEINLDLIYSKNEEKPIIDGYEINSLYVVKNKLYCSYISIINSEPVDRGLLYYNDLDNEDKIKIYNYLKDN